MQSICIRMTLIIDEDASDYKIISKNSEVYHRFLLCFLFFCFCLVNGHFLIIELISYEGRGDYITSELEGPKLCRDLVVN